MVPKFGTFFRLSVIHVTASHTSDANCWSNSSAADGSVAFKTLGRIPRRHLAKLRAPSFSSSSGVFTFFFDEDSLFIVAFFGDDELLVSFGGVCFSFKVFGFLVCFGWRSFCRCILLNGIPLIVVSLEGDVFSISGFFFCSLDFGLWAFRDCWRGELKISFSSSIPFSSSAKNFDFRSIGFGERCGSFTFGSGLRVWLCRNLRLFFRYFSKNA